MAINVLTQTAKLLYKEAAFPGGIERLFFPSMNRSLNAVVNLDQLTGAAYAARSITMGEPANVRPYTPGVGHQFEVPIAREKTPIDESLYDAVVAGLEDNAPQMAHLRELVDQIINGPLGHVAAHNMNKAKQAIDVMRTGIFYAKQDGTTIETVDYGRASALTSLTYDFGASGANFDAGIKTIYDALKSYRMPTDNLAVLLGASWFEKFAESTAVTDKRKATRSQELIDERMIPPLLQGIPGLNIVARYKVNGIVRPVWILVYEPGFEYKASEDASSEPFVPDAEAIMFNIGAPAWHCQRGIVVLNNGKATKQVGDIIFDEFTQNDPVMTWLRSQSRHLFVPGNVNHAAKITGSNF